MKARQADDNLRKNENKKKQCKMATLIAKHLGPRNTKAAKRRKLNPEHVREIEWSSFGLSFC